MPLSQYITNWTNFFSRGGKEEAEYFVENVATLLDAGIGFTDALGAVSKDIKSPVVKGHITKVYESVKNGEPFWQSLEGKSLVPDYAIPIIKFGESSGQLVKSLYTIAKYQQKNRVFRSKLFSAMSYPAIVFSITIIVGVLIAWFVLPNLKTVFGQLDLRLPLITKILLAVGEFLSKYGLVAVPVFMFSFFMAGYIVFVFPPTKHIGQSILFAIPLTRRLVQEIEISRFSEGLGMLLQSGAPPVMALTSVTESSSFRDYKELYRHVIKVFSEGGGLKVGFESYPNVERLFPSSVVQIISAGEQSGKLADNLLRIGARYEDKLEITIKNLPVILEPILLFIVWGGVMIIAIAVILPLYQLIGQL